MLEIVPVPVLRDNYVWLMHDPASLETVGVLFFMDSYDEGLT